MVGTVVTMPDTRRWSDSLYSLFRSTIGHYQPARQRDALMMVLAFGSGSLDAISFLALGKVFASVITGNLVLLGVGIVDQRDGNALHAGLAIAAYLIGVAVGVRLSGRAVDGQPLWPRPVTVALYVELVLLAGLVVGWELSGGHPGGGAQLVLLVVVTAAMGVQSAAVNRLGATEFGTTYLTGTLVKAVTELTLGPRRKVGIKLVALSGVLAGALAGAGLFESVPRLAPVLALVLLGLVVVAATVLGRQPAWTGVGALE
jgi:uncharacterized membrane protein YoaK (UPF0700 family)